MVPGRRTKVARVGILKSTGEMTARAVTQRKTQNPEVLMIDCHLAGILKYYTGYFWKALSFHG
jgi:hypothetical protein